LLQAMDTATAQASLLENRLLRTSRQSEDERRKYARALRQ